MVFLLLILGVAVYFDLRERRIPNFLIVVGLPAGLIHSATQHGFDGLTASLWGLLVAGGVLFPFFAVRMVGAGDVKLMAVVGAFVGLDDVWRVVLYVFLAGGIIGVIGVLAAGTTRQFFWNLKLWFHSLVFRGRGNVMAVSDIAAQSASRIPYALAIGAGTATWMLTKS